MARKARKVEPAAVSHVFREDKITRKSVTTRGKRAKNVGYLKATRERDVRVTERHSKMVENGLSALLPSVPELKASPEDLYAQALQTAPDELNTIPNRIQRQRYAALEVKKELAAEKLGVGGTFEEAGDIAGVSAGTVKKWLELREFRDRVDELRSVRKATIGARIEAWMFRRTESADALDAADPKVTLAIYDRIAGALVEAASQSLSRTSPSTTTPGSWADFLALPDNDPLKPRSLWMTPDRKAEVFRSWGLKALPWQAEAHSSTARFLVCDCGRRAGKTAFAGREAALQCLIPESVVWIVAPEMNLGEKAFRVVWELAVRKGLIPVEGKSRREHWIEFKNGSKIEVRTEENPDQLIGEGVDLMIIDEAAILKPTTWDQLLRPTLSDRPGRAIFTSTPRGRNYFYRLWTYGQHGGRENGEKTEWENAAADAGEDPREWQSWQLPTAVNPTILRSDIERIDRLIASDPVTYTTERQEWRAEFISYKGIVFPEFSNAVHVRHEPYEPTQKTMLWVDPGFTNPYAVLLIQVTGDERVRVLAETYRTQMTTDEIIAECERKWPHIMFEGGVVGNPPNSELEVIVDEAAAEAIASWRIKGYNAYGIKPPLRTGIEVYHRMLRDPFRRVDPTPENPLGIWPRITFDPQCEHAIEEHNLYHYPDENRRRAEIGPSEVPVDADNHAISAMRYGLYAVWPELFNERSPETTVQTYSEEDLETMGFDLARMHIESVGQEEQFQGWDSSLGDY